LQHAFAEHGKGDLSDEHLREAEDEAIRAVVRKQEALRLPIITDGEFRRLNFQDSFANSVSGFAAGHNTAQLTEQRAAGGRALQRWDSGMHIEGPAIVHRRPVVTRLRLVRNVPLAEFEFAQSLTSTPLKVTFIGPDRVLQRYAWEESIAVYSGLDEFAADLVQIQRSIVGELVDAGCTYVHVDAPSYTAYIDTPSLEQMRARGEDPEQNLMRSIAADNAIIEGFEGVTFGIHLCRGNQRSMWHREGTYDAIAEKLFGDLKHQRILLEYDDERSGGFEALRYVPRPGPVVVLGLITTKTPREETVDDLKRRIEEASRYLPLEQLALSPQCGFASEMLGNLISEDDQWRKLDIMLETARQVWR
jgi:5-methyltetrahydropteroyltriglutamate--homocysteine methyltransferase